MIFNIRDLLDTPEILKNLELEDTLDINPIFKNGVESATIDVNRQQKIKDNIEIKGWKYNR